MKLRISDKLALPLDWMSLATVVYGARGSGKTTWGSVAAEEVTKARQRFCTIDLKGDWYGLKSTADGKGQGIPVIVFGGDHADVPLEEGAGTFLAETVANLSQSCILDFENMSKKKQIAFLADFFETLYHKNRDPLLLLLDEAQRYAPQKPMDPTEGRCLGAVQDIVKLGRKHGLGPVVFTQRGAGLNKEVSELCDMLVAFRTPGPLDQDRIKGWLDANATREQRDDVMGKISGLDTGTAIFASNHPDLKIFGCYPVRRRETFDSSATPKIGQRKKEPKVLAKPELEELRGKMAAAIERQKADDPKELRRKIVQHEQVISQLERQVRAVNSKSIVQVKEKKVPFISEKHVARLQKLGDDLSTQSKIFKNYAEKLSKTSEDLLRIAAANVAKTTIIVPPNVPGAKVGVVLGKLHPIDKLSRDTRSNGAILERSGDTGLTKMERAMLTALAQYPDGRSRKQLLTLTSYSDSGPVGACIRGLLSKNWIVQQGNRDFAIVDDGLDALGPFTKLPTGGALIEHWIAKLDKMPSKIFSVLVHANGASLSRAEILEQAGYADSGPVGAAMRLLLNRLELIEELPGRLYKVNERLFN